MAETLAFRVRASREQLQRVEEKIDAWGRRQKLSDELLFKVKLVVEEVGLNVIDYGYEGDDSGEMEIRLQCGDGILAIDIIDQARAFDPLTETSVPDTTAGIEERPIGGLGLHLVKQMVDEASYAREGGRNRLSLKIQLTP